MLQRNSQNRWWWGGPFQRVGNGGKFDGKNKFALIIWDTEIMPENFNMKSNKLIRTKRSPFHLKHILRNCNGAKPVLEILKF